MFLLCFAMSLLVFAMFCYVFAMCCYVFAVFGGRTKIPTPEAARVVGPTRGSRDGSHLLAWLNARAEDFETYFLWNE